MGQGGGYTLVFYDISDLVASDDIAVVDRSGTRRGLSRIPTVSNPQILFVDAHDVLAIRFDGQHTHVHTPCGAHLCNLNIANLDMRLDARALRAPPPQPQLQPAGRDATAARRRAVGAADGPWRAEGAGFSHQCNVLARAPGRHASGYFPSGLLRTGKPAPAQRLRWCDPAAVGAIHRRFALLGEIPRQICRT